jgi:hypothetical protein
MARDVRAHAVAILTWRNVDNTDTFDDLDLNDFGKIIQKSLTETISDGVENDDTVRDFTVQVFVTARDASSIPGAAA